MSTLAKPAAARGAQKGFSVVGNTARKAGEPELPDDEDGDGEDNYVMRMHCLELAVDCYVAAHAFENEGPTPQFSHPVKLAETMRQYIEEGKTL